MWQALSDLKPPSKAYLLKFPTAPSWRPCHGHVSLLETPQISGAFYYTAFNIVSVFLFNYWRQLWSRVLLAHMFTALRSHTELELTV